MSNSLNDLVELTVEFGNLENERKGPRYSKMNCFLLDDEEYVNDLTEKIPVWIAEGREQLSDDCCVWEWIKYNIRAHAIFHSKRRGKQINEKETKIQN